MAGAPEPRARLFELLRTRSFERKRVVLASGRERRFLHRLQASGCSRPRGTRSRAWRCSTRLATFARVRRGHAGVEVCGCPLASEVALKIFQRCAPLYAVYVPARTRRDHGSKRTLEGNTRLAAGARLVLLEDVVTTGGSTLSAAAKLRAAGYVVAGVVALVDRLEGGRDAIEGDGLPLVALFTRADFIPG